MMTRLRTIPPADDSEARARYERLVAEYERRTGKTGVHWEELSPLEREYWVRAEPPADLFDDTFEDGEELL